AWRPARPSAHGIVDAMSRGTGRGMDGGDPVPAGHVLTAAVKLEWAPGRVAERLGELGYTVPQRSWPQTPPDRDDLTLLSRNLDRRHPWLDPEQPVPAGHVPPAAVKWAWGPGRLPGRLGELGYTVPQRSWPQTPPDRDDLTLLSRNLDRLPLRLALPNPVPAGHVLTAAVKLEWAPGRVAERLGGLGEPRPERSWRQTPPDRDDLTMLSRNMDRRHPWLDPDEPVPAGRALTAAVRLAAAPA